MTAAQPPRRAVRAEPPKRGFALPSAYTILFVLIVFVAALTWIIPAGQYDVNEDGPPIPGTYHSVHANPQRIVRDSLLAPINGLYGIESAEDGTIDVWNSGELFGAIDVALFILVIGGFLGVTMKTGAIQGGIAPIVARLRGRERLMIPILMVVFAIGGTTYGMAEESLAFYALIITVMIAAGYDSLTGAAILLLGCGIGVLGSTINPFATGIASGFAGMSIEEGLVLRLVILVVGTIDRHLLGASAMPTRSKRIRRPRWSPRSVPRTRPPSLLPGDADGNVALSGRQKAALALFFLAFAVMIYGVVPWSDIGIPLPTLCWWFPEMTASFLLFSILIWLVSRMCETTFTDTFVDGARDLLGVALIIGIARGITVIMNNGLITDTVLNCCRTGRVGPGRRRVHQPDVRGVHPALVPDPVVIRPGHRGHADHGAAGQLRRRPAGDRRDGVSDRERPGEPGHADLGRRHGRAGHRPRGLRHLAQVRLAGPDHAGDPVDRGLDRCDAAAMMWRTKRPVWR